MTLDDLRVFVAVCRAGSLSAVARDLGRTQVVSFGSCRPGQIRKRRPSP
ncbi:LysR family transcriptional regulator, partial [Streptomyces sp. NPDC058401]